MRPNLFGLFPLIPLLLLSAPSQALQTYPISQQKIAANISSHQLNRIAVENDRIAQIFGMTGRFVAETDEVQGQVFIRPSDSNAKKPLNVTLITESGLTQDLLLTPLNIDAETILLKGGNADKEEASRWEQASPYKETLVALIQAMTQGHALQGFGIAVVNQPLALRRDLQLTRTKLYKGDKLEGSVYELKNLSSQTLMLCEKRFQYEKRILAIALRRHQLKPGESTTLFMVKHV